MISRKFVIADPGRCIGCKTCMAACLHRHDVEGDVAVPRLQLVTTRTVSAPIGCHHCVEAPCVEACPTGCLYSDVDRVGVYKEKCIGCRNCILACPYGAVDIVTEAIPPEAERASACAADPSCQRGPSSPLSGELDPKPESASSLPLKKGKRRRARMKSTVIKCDLCAGHPDGSACVATCPTHALRLIDQNYLERGIQNKRKVAAKATVSYSSLPLNPHLDEGV